MKKILIITDNLRNQINGVVTTFNNLQIQAEKDGYEIVFIDPSNFPHYDLPKYPDVKISIPWNIGEKIIAANPDYVHIATEGPIGFVARLWLDKRKWRYNTSYHTKFPEFAKKLFGIPEAWTYWYVRWFHKHSGKVLTTTDTMVRDLRDHGFLGEIIPWTRGVDKSIFTDDLRKGKRSEKKFLLSVGRVSKEKDLDEFCNLDIPNTIKVVVGDGPYYDHLRRTYPDVRFAGSRVGPGLAAFYANADVFVFTSKVDTFGIVIIEALSVGTPVAAYPVPGPIDIITQGVDGYMDTNLRTAVEKCLTLDRSVVAESGKKWTWENCWKIFKDNLVEVNQKN